MKRRNFLTKYIMIIVALTLSLIYNRDTVARIIQRISSSLGMNEREVDKEGQTKLNDQVFELMQSKSDWINIGQPPYNIPGDGSDQSAALQQILNLAKEKGCVYLYFPQGEYGMSGYLRLYQNTYVLLHDKAKIKRLGKGYKIFVNGAMGNSTYASKYNGEGNIHFTGGTIDLNAGNAVVPKNMSLSAFDLGHGENISFQNVTIENGQNGHYLQIASCKDVRFENCKFKNNNYSYPTSTFFEVIQIEEATRASFPSFGGYDGTISKNIIIDNCTFENVVRAIGTHGKSNSDKKIIGDNIKIINNNFINSKDNTLNLTSYQNVFVENNIIFNSKANGIVLNNVSNSIVGGNTIVGCQKSGILLNNSKDSRVSKNYIKDVCLEEEDKLPAIFLVASNRNTFDDNTVFANKPRYNFAFFTANQSTGNKITSHNFNRGKSGLIGGANNDEINNIKIGPNQDLLFEGEISEKNQSKTLKEDIRNYSYIIVVGNNSRSPASQLTTLLIPRAITTIGKARSSYRFNCNQGPSTNWMEFSFPTSTSIRVDALEGEIHIRKIIGV